MICPRIVVPSGLRYTNALECDTPALNQPGFFSPDDRAGGAAYGSRSEGRRCQSPDAPGLLDCYQGTLRQFFTCSLQGLPALETRARSTSPTSILKRLAT